MQSELDPKEMFDAVGSRNIELVKALLEQGHSLDYRDEKQRTLLHRAAATTFSVMMVNFLVENGLDINAQDISGATPYEVAWCWNTRERVRELGGKTQGEINISRISVVVDFDQTIANTEENIVESYQLVPRKVGRREPSREEIVTSLSISRANTIAKFWPDWVDGVKEFDRVEKELGLPGIPSPFPDAIYALLQLGEYCGFLGMITSRRRESLDKTLCGMLDCTECDVGVFHYIQALHDYPHYKPDPKVFDMVLAEIAWRGLTGAVYYVGDAINDYLATIGTPVVFIAVLTGSVSRQEFLEAGVKWWQIADTFAEVPGIVETLSTK